MSSRSGAAPSFQDTPSDLLVHIVEQFLTPAERSNVACCNQALWALFPPLLRIQIASSNQVLASKVYVSLLHQPHQTALLHTESLRYGVPYHLWTFDYQRSNKVYLGRHTRHHDDSEGVAAPKSHLFTLGLIPKTPTQHWMILGGRKVGDPVKED